MYHLISVRQNVTNGLGLFAKVAGIPLLLYIFFLGYQYWHAEPAPRIPLASFGLEVDPTDEDVSLAGVLYLSAVVAGTEEPVYPNVYTYDFSAATFTSLFSYPGYAFHGVNDGYGAMLGPVADVGDPDDLVPMWYSYEAEELGPLAGVGKYNEGELTVAPEGAYYAYSYQDTADANPFDLTLSNIALHNFETGEIVTIPGAGEPHFFNNGADLAFMRPDGIYRYHVATGEITPLYQAYESLSAIDDYAISPDNTSLILTAPTIHVVSVARLNEETNRYQEIGVHLDTSYRYRHPVISPDSRLYAVVAVEEASFVPELNQYTNAAIEFRLVEGRQIVERQPLDAFTPDSVALNSWGESTQTEISEVAVEFTE